MNAKSKMKRHNILKRKMMRNQHSSLVLGRGLNPTPFIDTEASMIRVTKEGIFSYR